SRFSAPMNRWQGHKFRRSLLLPRKTIDHFLILAWRLSVFTELVVSGTPGYIRARWVNARQSSWGNIIFIFIGVAVELGDVFKLIGAEYAATVRSIGVIPAEAWHNPVVHPDIEVRHHNHRCLKPFGQVERFYGEFEALRRVGRKQKNVFRIAMRSVGALQEICLLRAGWHSCRGTYSLNIDDYSG